MRRNPALRQERSILRKAEVKLTPAPEQSLPGRDEAAAALVGANDAGGAFLLHGRLDIDTFDDFRLS